MTYSSELPQPKVGFTSGIPIVIFPLNVNFGDKKKYGERQAGSSKKQEVGGHGWRKGWMEVNSTKFQMGITGKIGLVLKKLKLMGIAPTPRKLQTTGSSKVLQLEYLRGC